MEVVAIATSLPAPHQYIPLYVSFTMCVCLTVGLVRLAGLRDTDLIANYKILTQSCTILLYAYL